MERNPAVGGTRGGASSKSLNFFIFASDAFLGFYCFNIRSFPYNLSLGCWY